MPIAQKVALVRCEDYDLGRVQTCLGQALDLLGGVSSFVRPGQRVLLKPNLLRAMSPDTAATTHPAVVAAAARLVREAGGLPVILDSPGGPYSPILLRRLYRRTGMEWAAEISGAELNYDVTTEQVPLPAGRVLHRLDIVRPLLDADVLINLAKFKTHNLTTLTLSIKNLFGLVPGALKVGYHGKLQNKNRFVEGLVDILLYARPALNIIDAVVAMEGNGPSGGDPRALGALIAAADAFAADIVAAALVGLSPTDVATTEAGCRRGLTTGRIEDLRLLGDPLDELRVADFRRGTAADVDPGLLPRKLLALVGGARGEEASDGRTSPGKALVNWFGRQLVPLPSASERCIGCGFCVKHCPVDAIRIVDDLAQMDASKCIRCYCCHELCPELAVELRRPFLGRLILGG